jgi:catechol-2,3-dioxygenase
MGDRPVLMHTAVDALDVRRLAAFYRDLLGLHPRPGDEDSDDWVVLLDEDGRRVMAINLVDRLARSTWPDDDVPKQLHMDFAVPDLEALERHRARAEELGATLLLDRTDHEEPLYVLADPEGHPFCLLVGD